jgi:hypothetical protein
MGELDRFSYDGMVLGDMSPETLDRFHMYAEYLGADMSVCPFARKVIESGDFAVSELKVRDYVGMKKRGRKKSSRKGPGDLVLEFHENCAARTLFLVFDKDFGTFDFVEATIRKVFWEVFERVMKDKGLSKYKDIFADQIMNGGDKTETAPQIPLSVGFDEYGLPVGVNRLFFFGMHSNYATVHHHRYAPVPVIVINYFEDVTGVKGRDKVISRVDTEVHTRALRVFNPGCSREDVEELVRAESWVEGGEITTMVTLDDDLVAERKLKVPPLTDGSYRKVYTKGLVDPDFETN